MASIRYVVALALLSLVAGCSGPRQGEPVDAAVPAASTSPGIVDGAPCRPAPEEAGLPEGTGCSSSVVGTFQRDQGRQVLTVYATLDDDDFPTGWRMTVTGDAGTVLDEPVNIGSAASYPLAVGAADADRDGIDEAFVRVLTHLGHSGATHEFALFGVRWGHIFRVRADDAPLLFPVGGVSTFGEGAECRDVDLDGDPEFLLLRIDYVFGEEQRWSERVYEWSHRSLTLARRKEGRFAKTGYFDPLLYRYYSLRCFEFEPPFPYARG